ncbi:MAG: 30S ribosomal protein S4 [Candidatus Buchananbacteria bacterium CG10_big_fil_rev_8_21_14_0_10_42_9]|uniref:Small ribosomal subunit protein uS4 n=1 Tax=Candidatus Buchananbacteria bacterium CG10_big_fil_rev_8_21_14_0_10_42_9 TaxID=1974526 RepID=A0A2H0W139_9BACT|nr:MAG: 30S ribosomal protein S4 [Candidatus Buchananbacteria bacterium CG10_big_fil_rev_8_21_14_0_10_42_9]
MAKNLDSKCKLCRREGEKLFLKGERCYTPKCAITKRNYPPGIHGVKGKPRLTNFGLQLREKQKAKRIYQISEKQFFNYYQKASKKKGNTGENMMQMLEMRLDNVVFKMGLTPSRSHARQLITHNYYKVNDKVVNIPSYQVKPKDVITLNENKKDKKAFTVTAQVAEKMEVPGWLDVNEKEKTAKVANIPKLDEIQQPFNPALIVEFYSR